MGRGVGKTERGRWRAAALAALTLGPLLGVSLLAAAPAAAAGTRPAAGTVYVTNLDTNSVTFFNPATGSVGVISGAGRGLNGPLGIAIAPNGETAYVTNSLGDTVSPLALTPSSGTPEPSIRVGSAPAAIAIAPDGRTAYVSNFDSNTVTPIDLATSPATAEKPINVGAGPWSIAISADGRWVVVADSEAQSVSVINTATRRVTTVALGARPQAIAVSPRGATAYVANGNAVTPINLAAGSAGAPITVAGGPVGIAVAPDGRTAYTANTNNTVTPIDLATSPARTESPIAVADLSQPDGIAVAPNGNYAFAANASDTVTPIRLNQARGSSATPVQVGTASFGIAIVPDQGPVARVSVKRALAGHATTFDAAASTSPNDRITRYRWSFGDGTVQVTATPRTTHVYHRAGDFTLSLVETTADGTSQAQTFTGQNVSNEGSPTARVTTHVVIGSALQLNPTAGSPGEAVTLRDNTFTARCADVNIFFDGRLIGEASPTGHLLDDKDVVIPGDATLGEHRVELSCTTAAPWLLTGSLDVVNSPNHLSEFSVAMPTLKEIKSHLAGATGISLLLLLLSRIIAAGFPSQWLDGTYEANRHRISRRARQRFPKLFIDRSAPRSRARRFVGGLALFISFIVSAGVINSFLNPTFGFNRTTLWLFLGECVGVALVTLTSQIVTVTVGLRLHRRIHLQVLLGAMMIAVICVASSRAVGLAPGYCYGLIAVFMLNPEVDHIEEGKLHAISSVVVLCVSIAAFFATIPVYHAATAANPSPLLLILDPALNVVFLGGFSSLAFGMFPLPFLPGRHVARWNRWVWGLISGVGLVGFVVVLLTPGSGSKHELHHVGLVPLIVAFVIFGLFSLGFMAYFHLRPSSEPEGEHHASGAHDGHGESAEPVESNNHEIVPGPDGEPPRSHSDGTV